MKNVIIVIVGIIVVIFSCFAGLVGGFIGSSLNTNGTLSELANTITQDVKVTDEQSAIIDVVSKASPSVVSIVISKDLPKYYSNPYYDYFGSGSSSTDTVKQTIGAGSGFVISSDGKTGFVVKNDSDVIDSLVTALNNISTINRLDCRRSFEDNFTIARMANDHLKVYSDFV